MGNNNFHQYYSLSLMRFVLYLSLSSLLVLPRKSEALGYMKFNLYLSSELFRPYLTQIFLGTPAQRMNFYIDMGTDLVRFSCGVKEGETMPPAETLNENMPRGDYIPASGSAAFVFNVNESSSFIHIFCNSTGNLCPPQYQANNDDCSNETYCILPSDKPRATNNMYLSMDDLNMTGDFSPFRFACDPYDFQEFVTTSRGVLGLGRTEPSFFEEFGHMYDNCLSYCLPLDTSSTGYLAFGLQNNKCPGDDPSLVLTNLSVHPKNPSAYLINITSITVNKTQISINSSDQSGMLVNPATFFTTLPTGVYQAMRDEFKENNNSTVLIDYTYVNGGLDLCFNTSNGAATLKIPTVLMTFANNATVELDQLGIIYVVDETKSCLGFKGNDDPNSPSVFGGMQQAKLEVGIDVANDKVGFRPMTTCG